MTTQTAHLTILMLDGFATMEEMPEEGVLQFVMEQIK